MQLRDFDFHLPPELIAQNPVTPRDSARLLVFDRTTQKITHAQVKDLPQFLPPETLIVANNSRVRNSRLWALYKEKVVEVLILEKETPNSYTCLIGGRNIKPGANLQFCQSKTNRTFIPLTATVTKTNPHPAMTSFTLSFSGSESLESLFSQYGAVPLPPYITESTANPDQYQTIYAKESGSAAAPTAGLHFTPELVTKLAKNHSWLEVTLHVGMGTFLPLRQEEVTKNNLHAEATYIDQKTANLLNEARTRTARIAAIGTTSTRTLESHTYDNTLHSGWQNTELFIYPGFVFQTTNVLMTNFHLPKSSLLVLVAAFLGNDPTQRAVVLSEKEMIQSLQTIYQTAINERYRFFSFGDAMLIL